MVALDERGIRVLRELVFRGLFSETVPDECSLLDECSLGMGFCWKIF